MINCKGFLSFKIYINFLYDYDDHHHFKFREPIRVCTGNMGSDMLNNPGAALIVQGGLFKTKKMKFMERGWKSVIQKLL